MKSWKCFYSIAKSLIIQLTFFIVYSADIQNLNGPYPTTKLLAKNYITLYIINDHI